MPNTLPTRKLSRDEELFLRHWVYDEVHYQEGIGPAKRLQVQHRVAPANLAMLVAAAIPDPAEQQEIGVGPPPTDSPSWPWPSDETLHTRLAEAQTALAARNKR